MNAAACGQMSYYSSFAWLESAGSKSRIVRFIRLASIVSSLARSRRGFAPARGAVSCTGREKRSNCSPDDWASPRGSLFAVHGQHRGRTSALRSGARTLRPCRTSIASDPLWHWPNLILPGARGVFYLSRDFSFRLTQYSAAFGTFPLIAPISKAATPGLLHAAPECRPDVCFV
jgi:hypothetical protein